MAKFIITIVVMIILTCSIQAANNFEQNPIIEHLKLSMSDLDEFQYSLKRCAGLLLASGTAMHKLSKEQGAQEVVDMGEDLMEFLAKFQITKFFGKELTQEIFSKVYRDNIEEVQKFNRLYYLRFQNNFKEQKLLIEQDFFLKEEVISCMGVHDQLLRVNQ